MTLCGKRFIGLSQAVEKLDLTRWTFFNGDHDIGDQHCIISTHYMLEGAGRDPRAGFEFNGHSAYFPDAAFLKPFDKDLKEGDQYVLNIHGPAPYKVGSKVLTDTENQWKVAGYQPPGKLQVHGRGKCALALAGGLRRAGHVDVEAEFRRPSRPEHGDPLQPRGDRSGRSPAGSCSRRSSCPTRRITASAGARSCATTRS